jgi:hypothetical protein
MVINRSLFKQVLVLAAFAPVVSLVLLNGCNNNPTPPSLASHIADGKAAAQKYCVSCHEFPDPALIDRKSWVSGVLPAMGKNLGIKQYMGQYYTDAKSSLNISDWQNIITYYTQTSPVNLDIPKPAVAPLKDWSIFSLIRPKNVNQKIPAMTTMITVDTLNHKVYSGDAGNNLFEWDAALNSKLVYHFDSPVTGATYLKTAGSSNTAVVTCIGNLPPVNLSTGKVYSLNLDQKKSKPVLIADGLPRAVASVAADFNKDGLMDYVTCGFGHDNGGLYYLQQQPDHSFKKIQISAIAGGEQLITGDFNNDGWPDVICLFAQADEGIRMFLNDKKGGFITKTLLRFPPVYGSSSFQLIDFNHDGKPDILYTCGDNSDFSKVLKPYHGVYIFTNQGDWTFKQTYFYHINGCTKAIADDFEHNGKIDIAAIAFFPDFKDHPDESFTYLRQNAANQFTAYEVPVSNCGRWLEMEVTDMDGDGYDDIILGNFSIGGRGLVNLAGFVPAWDMHEPVILLKNNAGKKH